MFAVTWQFSSWRTVTGIRAPWSVHKEVMPRLRAMTPVRIEFGVHLGGGGRSAGDAEVLGLGEARAVLECIRRTEAASGGLSAKAHSLSMQEEAGKQLAQKVEVKKPRKHYISITKTEPAPC